MSMESFFFFNSKKSQRLFQWLLKSEEISHAYGSSATNDWTNYRNISNLTKR